MAKHNITYRKFSSVEAMAQWVAVYIIRAGKTGLNLTHPHFHFSLTFLSTFPAKAYKKFCCSTKNLQRQHWIHLRDSPPKNEYYVIIYSPLCRSKPVCIFVLRRTLKNIFWRMLVPKQFWFPMTSYCIFCLYNGSHWELRLFGFQHPSIYSIFNVP